MSGILVECGSEINPLPDSGLETIDIGATGTFAALVELGGY